MQCYATQCYTMPCNATECGRMLCNAMQCYGMQCCAMPCNAMHCHAMLCNAMQCYAMLRNAMQCYAVLCSAMRCTEVGCFCVRSTAWAYDEMLQILKSLYSPRWPKIVPFFLADRHHGCGQRPAQLARELVIAVSLGTVWRSAECTPVAF